MLPELKGLTFGERVAYLRNRLGLSQEELAGETGIDLKRIQKYEGGVIRRPRSKNLKLLCETLRVTREQLVGDLVASPEVNPHPTAHSESLRAATAKITEALRDVVERTPERCAFYEATSTSALDSAELRRLLAWMDRQGIESISVIDGSNKLSVLVARRAEVEPGEAPMRPATLIRGGGAAVAEAHDGGLGDHPAEASNVSVLEAKSRR
jgi:transcriptional regulator with XRE-family HTH domain